MPKPKVVTDEQHHGDQGETLAQLLIKEMGHEYHPAGRNEAGVDGFIELRHGGTGEVDAQFLACQVKTGKSEIEAETDSEFKWRATPGDLAYWEQSTVPVIIVVVRLETHEGWWRAVDQAFADEAARAARLIHFDKERDRLNGAPGDVLWGVVRRDRDRRQAVARMSLSGPFAVIGLSAELDAVQQLETERRWIEAAQRWQHLAEVAVQKRLDRRLVWPALTAAAQALQHGGQRAQAGELWIRLAAGRVDDDDPEATFDVARAQWTQAWTGTLQQQLIAVRAALPEAGIDALDDLRELFVSAKAAADRQAVAAALADALVFFGYYEEAHTVAEKVLGKVHGTPHKRQLALDRLDCAGELGLTVEDDWVQLLEDWRDRGPHLYGQALQRRAVFALRRGQPDEARRRFQQAGEVWSGTDGGEEQVAEVALSAALVGSLSDHVRESMLPGARAAAAIARGSIRTPAVRSDRLLLDGLSYLADGRRPDALNRLTLAAMVDRRAGNLFSWRRTAYMLARAYQDADEHVEALRFWIQVGAEQQAAEVARNVESSVAIEMLRLGSGPPWEQAAGLAALEHHAARLPPDAVAALSPALIAAASPTPTLVAPQPSFHARKTLAAIADRLPVEFAQGAAELFTEDLRRRAPNASESSRGLVVLTQRKLVDGVPAIIEALLAGDRLPVTVAGWLRDADELVRRPLVEAALAGNQVALAEAAAADLPLDDERLAIACDRSLQAAVDAEQSDHEIESIGMSFVHLGDLARFALPQTQIRFIDLLTNVVVAGTRYDEISKISALITIAIAAPGLSPAAAEQALQRLMPLACGEPAEHAPAMLTDHRNPKRARTVLNRSTSSSQLRAAAIQACSRLAQLVAPTSGEVEAMLRAATLSGEAETVRTGLRELARLAQIGADIDPQSWLTDNDPAIRAAAEQLAQIRGQQPTDPHGGIQPS